MSRYNFKVADGYDLSNYDQDAVKQAQGGTAWGQQDQARYDKIMADRKAKESSGVTNSPNQQQIQARSEAKEKAQAVLPPGHKSKSAVNNKQEQNINQDNDINSSVEGNDNYVYNTQDNSIRQYGGDNRSLVINNKGPNSVAGSLDGAGTAGTLAGIWDADDSPGAKASRLSQHVTMNRDNQKKYAETSHIAQGAISRANQNSYINPANMDKRISERQKVSEAKATVMGGNIFGDMFNFKTPDWNSANPAEEVETPDFDKMYNKYTKF